MLKSKVNNLERSTAEEGLSPAQTPTLRLPAALRPEPGHEELAIKSILQSRLEPALTELAKARFAEAIYFMAAEFHGNKSARPQLEAARRAYAGLIFSGALFPWFL